MRPELLLAIAQRDLPAEAQTWLTMGLRELALAEAGLRLHRQQRAAAGISASMAHAEGMHSFTSNGARIFDLIAKHRPTSAEEMGPLMAEISFPEEAAELAARGVVYSLAVLRNALRRAGEASPAPLLAQAHLRVLDKKVPGLVAVRDTLAHLDERYVGLSREKTFEPAPFKVQGQKIRLGSAIEGDRISAHTADGTVQHVMLTSDTIAAAMRLWIDIMELFPKKSPVGALSAQT